MTTNTVTMERCYKAFENKVNKAHCMGASMRVFVIVAGMLDRQTENRLLASFWHTAYFISGLSVGNGYMEYTFGQQYANSTKESIAQILTINNIPYFEIQ